MPPIRILPEILSNKIAAGEVVERPASVVKELVENALDAGSTRIIVDIEKGGRSLIRVADNGSGMGHDDALLALERYATSKIATDEDLYAIGTLGFRGEALPSIAAVSKLTLATREADQSAGCEIEVDGGRIQKVSQIGAPAGTMVTVRRLFFNTPARRKFLKTVATEMGHIADVVSSLALAHPQVDFKLRHNDHTVKHWPAAADERERVVDVLGQAVGTHLHRLELEKPDLTVTGWIATPQVTRSTSRNIYLFVNGRWVKDKVLLHALFHGYAQRLVKGQYPLAVLFISVPFDQVDVNVHPTKHEIRFARQRYVHDAIADGVAGLMNQADRPAWAPPSYGPEKTGDKPAGSAPFPESTRVFRPLPGAGEPVSGYRPQPTDLKSRDSGSRMPAPATRPGYSVSGIGPHQPVAPSQPAIWETRKFASLRVIGQLRNTYVICESDDGLMLIDQHAAHERIYYEQLKKQAARKSIAVQNLLVPETVELGFGEAGLLKKRLSELADIGLEMEPFGGNTFVVKAVPAMLAGQEIRPLVIEIAQKLASTGFSDDLTEAIDATVQLMACHGAIRASQSLSDRHIQALLEQLDDCDNPSHCPHGRPTWVQMSLYELEKRFKRKV